MINFFNVTQFTMFSINSINTMDDIADNIYGNFNLNNNNSNYIEEEDNDIMLLTYDDMYVLTIYMRGVDLRELSIQYNFDKIVVTLNRLETAYNNFGMPILTKNKYSKSFDNLESIEVNNVSKSIDGDYLYMTMPKKYIISDNTKIVDAKFSVIEDSQKLLKNKKEV